MSIEFLFRFPDENLPFVDKGLDTEQEKYLGMLNLTPGSSAGEVRSAAISFRHKFEEGGLNTASVRALRWALEITKDIMNDAEFLRFILNGSSFENIEDDRFNFR
jgi:hypothetical protein